MKRFLKITLISLGILVVLLGTAAFLGWRYFNRTFVNFEKDYPENRSFSEANAAGYTYWDRNGNGELDVYEDARQPLEARVANLLSLMTVEEKIHLLKGSGIPIGGEDTSPGAVPGAAGAIVPTPRLGLPRVILADGPAGLRIAPTRSTEEGTFYCTAFPIATLLGSTWNQDLVYEVGEAMGNEALEYGVDVVLGPGANIHRHPLCGRNFEYYSEDPLLTGLMGAAMVNGIESNGVGTALKHYVANNQETERGLNDVIISERALREIYLKGFELVVDQAQPWTIMSSYNKVNGTYTSESKYLLTDILRDDWGFEGLVMTDWFGGRDAAAQVRAGNDLLEPGTKRQWDALTEAYEEGTLSLETIDRSAGRLLSLVLQSPKMQNTPARNQPDLQAHAAITRRTATEGMVLLKNTDGLLPLASGQEVALLGVTAYNFIAGGSGSGDVNEAYSVSLEEGLTQAGFTVNETAHDIYRAHRAANEEGFQKPEGTGALFTPFSPPEMQFTADQLADIAASAQVGILTLGRNAGEGGDRKEVDDFLLSDVEQEMLKLSTEAFHAVGKPLVVVMNIGGVIETASWKDLPDAILLAWQGGQEGGNSVADILVGNENPSGKLPMTFPIQLADHASHANFPEGGENLTTMGLMTGFLFPADERPEEEKMRNRDYTHYDEGVYVGYRHFDKAALEVSYPFGFGLSYTQFAYSEPEAVNENDTITVTASVTNTGQRAGKEAIQVYVEKVGSAIDRPLQELKAFAKTQLLEPAATEQLTMQIPIRQLAYWDEEGAQWVIEPGAYRVKIGASSRDIRAEIEIEIEP